MKSAGCVRGLFVVKGVGIGHEIVSVHLLEPELKHMADKIALTVAEAISIEPPSPVYVLVGASVHYILKVVRGNIPQGCPTINCFLLLSAIFSAIFLHNT